MEFATLLQKRIAIVAILGISAFIGLIWTVGDGVVEYASWYVRPEGGTQVLGEKTESPVSCLPKETIEQFFIDTQKTITLYSPDKTVIFPLDSLKSCYVAKGCGTEGFTCKEGTISLDSACVAAFFKKAPLGVEQTKLVTGETVVAQVKVQDWSVNYDNLAEQLTKAIENEIKYCQVTKEEEQTRQNIGNLQLVVSDELPGMVGGDFTLRFLEVDISKGKGYFWNDGVYQVLSTIPGARLPKEGIYTVSSLALSKYFSSSDLSYINRNAQGSDYVVVHK